MRWQSASPFWYMMPSFCLSREASYVWRLQITSSLLLEYMNILLTYPWQNRDSLGLSPYHFDPQHGTGKVCFDPPGCILLTDPWQNRDCSPSGDSRIACFFKETNSNMAAPGKYNTQKEPWYLQSKFPPTPFRSGPDPRIFCSHDRPISQMAVVQLQHSTFFVFSLFRHGFIEKLNGPKRLKGTG